MMRKWLLGVIVCLIMLLMGAGEALAGDAYVETPLWDASEAQLNNIRLAAQAIDGSRVGFGEGFSFNDTVGERSEEYGYVSAVNGRGVKVIGGGVAQTATTLYLALMQRDDIEYSSIYTYNEKFTGSYVDSGYDAVVTDYWNGLDFSFNSYYEGELVVYMWIDGDALCCFVTEEPYRDTEGGDWDGLAETPLSDAYAQVNNIELAAISMDGWTLEPGDVFSFNEAVGPRDAEYGYLPAINGRGVTVVGGGVAQTAATLYLAVRDMENVEILEMRSYGERFTEDYVEDGEDAVLVDYRGGIDFSFEYLGDGTLSIYFYIEEDRLICEIYEE